MAEHNRRPLPALRRVTTYIPQEEYGWLVSLAGVRGWTVSRLVAFLIDDGHTAEKVMLEEMEEELRARDGRL